MCLQWSAGYNSDPPETRGVFARFSAQKPEFNGANTLVKQVCCAQQSVLTMRSFVINARSVTGSRPSRGREPVTLRNLIRRLYRVKLNCISLMYPCQVVKRPGRPFQIFRHVSTDPIFRQSSRRPAQVRSRGPARSGSRGNRAPRRGGA